jgi:hypothetical protein
MASCVFEFRRLKSCSSLSRRLAVPGFLSLSTKISGSRLEVGNGHFLTHSRQFTASTRNRESKRIGFQILKTVATNLLRCDAVQSDRILPTLWKSALLPFSRGKVGRQAERRRQEPGASLRVSEFILKLCLCRLRLAVHFLHFYSTL